MRNQKIASLVAVGVVGLGSAWLAATPAQAATGCTAKFTAHGRGSNNVYAHSSASCSGSVSSVTFTTKAYMYYVDHWADGTELGNRNMTMTKSGTGTESVTAQDDHCQYRFTTTVSWTSGGIRHSQGPSPLNMNICG